MADNGLKDRFWQGRSSYAIDPADPFLPVQLPGPLDTWAGAEPKRIELTPPYAGSTRLTLSLHDSHPQHPPRLRVSAGGEAVGDIQVLPGRGTTYPSWFFDGLSSQYEVTIPGRLLADPASRVALESVSGSWAVIRSIEMRRVPPAWVPWAGWLCLGLVLVVWLWRMAREGRWRQTAVNLGLAALSTLVALAGVEAALRLFWPQSQYVPSLRIVYDPDPAAGFRLRPGVRTNLGFDTNSLGLRDREGIAQAKPTGARRLLCLGDSFTFSFTSLADSYPKLLEKQLNEHGAPRVEVLNCGVPSYGTDNELAWLRAHGLALEPDLVILGLFVGNDITDNYAHPSYTAVGGTLVSLDQARDYTPGQVAWEARKRRFLGRFHLVRLLKNRNYAGVFAALGQREAAARQSWAGSGKGCLNITGGTVHRLVKDFPPQTRRGWENTIQLLDELTALAGREGLGLMILLIPDVMQFPSPGVLELRATTGPEFDWAEPQRALMALGRERGWPMWDALPGMLAAWRGEELFYCKDLHFNPRGNQLLAAEAKRGLEALGLRPAR